MLSRVANRLYWSARYLERSEGIARMVSAYTHFILDTPKTHGIGWEVLINIVEGEDAYFSRYSKITEQNVIRFLLSNEDNPASLRSSIIFARENMRTTRDVLPEKAWELVNELNLYTKRNVDAATKRGNRHDFLDQIMLHNLQLDGLFDGSMNRKKPFDFMRLGRYMERCDMATRIANVGIVGLPQKEGVASSLEMSLWANLLDSLSATSAYRREIGPIVSPTDATNFLFKYQHFPRSIRYSLGRVERVVQHLKDSDHCLALLKRINKKLDKFDAQKLSTEEIHVFIDQIQVDLSLLDNSIARAWFFPERQ